VHVRTPPKIQVGAAGDASPAVFKEAYIKAERKGEEERRGGKEREGGVKM